LKFEANATNGKYRVVQKSEASAYFCLYHLNAWAKSNKRHT